MSNSPNFVRCLKRNIARNCSTPNWRGSEWILESALRWFDLDLSLACCLRFESPFLFQVQFGCKLYRKYGFIRLDRLNSPNILDKIERIDDVLRCRVLSSLSLGSWFESRSRSFWQIKYAFSFSAGGIFCYTLVDGYREVNTWSRMSPKSYINFNLLKANIR